MIAEKTGVRLRAAGDAPVLYIARKNDEFVLDEPFLFGDRWIRVRTADGRVGWIAREHLRVGRAQAPKPEPAPGTRGLLADEIAEAASDPGEPELPIIRDPLPAWRTRVQVEYGAAYVRNEHARDGEDPYVWGVRRGAGVRATVLVYDPIVVDGALFGCRDFRERPAIEETEPEPRVEKLDRGELSVGWRDTWGYADQVALTLLAGVTRDYVFVEVDDSDLAAPVLKGAQHDATISGFRLEYGFLGNRLLVDGEGRHRIGRRSKGYSWGGGVRGRHRTGVEIGLSYRGSWYWQEERGGITYADRHVLSLALGKAF